MKKKITPELIAIARDLASSGFSHLQIMKSVGISSAAFYRNIELVTTIREAENELRQQIALDIKSSSQNGEVSAQIFLSKRLNLYGTSYKMPQIKTVKSAMNQISRINSDLANGVLPPELANNLVKNIEVFVRAHEVNELALEIEAIKERLDNQ